MEERKHAFMIGCYQNPDYLESFIDSLDGERSNFYIHINKKNIEDFRYFIDKMSVRENVSIVEPISINWGGMGLLKATRLMLNKAIANPDNYYFHLLTGQDALVRPLNELYSFFDQHKDSNFIPIVVGPLNENDKVNILDWMQYYHTFDMLNYRGSVINRAIEKGTVLLQKLFCRKRVLPEKNIYKGSGWFSLNRKAVSILQEYLNNENNLKKWRYTYAPDECLPHTLLYNSNENLNIVNDNLRFIVWNKEKKQFPAVLDDSFFDDIIKSNKFFCRKIDPRKSSGLLKKLKVYYNK